MKHICLVKQSVSSVNNALEGRDAVGGGSSEAAGEGAGEVAEETGVEAGAFGQAGAEGVEGRGAGAGALDDRLDQAGVELRLGKDAGDAVVARPGSRISASRAGPGGAASPSAMAPAAGRPKRFSKYW